MAELEAVPEDWSRALAVVAHPDDLEYGAACAIARWTDQGKRIAYVMVTAGEAGIDSMPPDRVVAVRTDEEIRSAAAVGVDTVEFLGHPDGLIEPSVALRRDLAAAIRRHRPEVLISINFR
ncbi:MAG TPA: PIG-L family deacetylase, partial [Acidimicrobiia bacterium]|nr:PIG-L family deacetylase [Acidimicrobiia bacterium]